MFSLLDSKLFWLGIIILTVELFRIQYYEIIDNTLIISRRIKSIRIKLGDIENIQQISIAKTFTFLRIFGANFGIGLFGIFWHPKHGIIHFYLKNRRNLLLLQMKNKKKIMISPQQEVYNSILNLI